MKKIAMTMLVVFALVFLWNCGPKISSTVKTNNDLSNYETYAYLPNSGAQAPDKLDQSEEVGRQIVEAMNKNMQKAGYTIDKEDPDLLVIINTDYDQETDLGISRDYNNAYYPYSRSLPVNNYYNNYYYTGYNNYREINDYDVTVSQYADSGMFVSLVDKDTKNIVWTGSIDDFYVYQDDASQAVATYVDEIFDDYPTISKNK